MTISRWLLVFATLILSSRSATAEYSGSISVFERRMNQGLASLKSSLRLQSKGCETQAARSCRFAMGPHSAILASAPGGSNLNSATLIFDLREKAEVMNFVVIVGSLAKALEPQAVENGGLSGFLPMATQTLDDSRSRSMQIGGTKLGTSFLMGMLIVTAERS